jgi:HEAT repeat protein
MEAAYALGTIGPKAEAAIPALKKAIEDKSLQVRFAARLALWRAASDEKQVRLALNDAAEQKSGLAALANSSGFFTQVGPGAVGVLVDNLQHPNAGVRKLIVTIISLLDTSANKQAVPALIQVLRDADPKVREAAADALRTIDPEAARKAGVK